MKWLGRSLMGLVIIAVMVVVGGFIYLSGDTGPKNVDSEVQVEDLELPDICDEDSFDDEDEVEVASLATPKK